MTLTQRSGADRRSLLAARTWHLVHVLVVGLALPVQTVLALTADVDRTPLGKLANVFSYFTIQSNILVLVSVALLAADPFRDGPMFRWLRLASLLGITVTGIVYVTVLRGLADFTGLAALCDKAFHYVSPLLAVLGWVLFGPRPRFSWALLPKVLLWPVAWLAYTLARGPLAHWYPYPFVDVDTLGYARVLLNCVVVTVLMLAVGAAYVALDRRLRARGELPAALPATEPA